jgi:hypothetical protein
LDLRPPIVASPGKGALIHIQHEEIAMAKPSKKTRVLAELSTPMKVQIRQPEFEPLASLKALDVKRLSRGNHKIEIGFVKGGCCRNLVRAVIKDGMVTGCEIEPCKDSGKAGQAPPELLAVLAKARKKIAGGKKWKPIAVSQLVRSNARMLDLIIIVGGGCIFICIWHFCIMCCWYPRPHCFIPDIIVGPL